MKFNKKRKIDRTNSRFVVLVFENCECIHIPFFYIKQIKKIKGKIQEIQIKKSLLNVIENYMCGWSDRDKDDMQKRFLSAYDVTQIHMGNGHYYPNYIEQSWSLLGADNVLQQIDIKEDMIVFHWDIDEVNRVVYKNNGCECYPDINLQLSKKYENIVFEGYDEVKFV